MEKEPKAPFRSSAFGPYRFDIDGIRAIAVCLVVLYHAFPAYLPGGFIGVDIFFVISGFLITGIISREIDDGSFTIARFYRRRVRRIFPALIIVLIATLAAGWWLLLPGEFSNLGLNAVAGAAFFSNIASMMQSGYFDLGADKKPLLHLWSLGIEEQFYLAWPLILLAISRLSKNRMTVVSGIVAVSFVLNVVLVWWHPVGTFYSPFTRAWELLVGGLILGHVIAARGRAAGVMSMVGLLLIGSATALLTPKSEFPGWWATLPVVGSALLLMSPGSFLARRVLTTKPFVWIGLISYPLYLWHWPLFVYGDTLKEGISGKGLTDLEKGLLIGISVLLAWATSSLVEKYFRRTTNLVKIAGLAAAMVSVMMIGIVIIHERGVPGRYPAEIRSIAKETIQSDRWRIGECMLNVGHTEFAESCSQSGHPSIFLWGDSTAGALSPGMLDLQKKQPFAFSQYTISSCEPLLPTFNLSERHDCPARNRQAFAAVKKLLPDIVVLEAVWLPSGDHLEALIETIKALNALGVTRVVVLGQVPIWPKRLQNLVVSFYSVHHKIPERLMKPSGKGGYDQTMKAAVESAGAEFISLRNILCNHDGCLATMRRVDGSIDITATDQVHLTEVASNFVVEKLAGRLLGDGRNVNVIGSDQD